MTMAAMEGFVELWKPVQCVAGNAPGWTISCSTNVLVSKQGLLLAPAALWVKGEKLWSNDAAFLRVEG